MGNGEIVLDENSKCMMPPPPNIESLLNNAVQFLLAQVMSMSTILGGDDSGDNKASGGGGASRSTASSSVSSYIAMLVGQIKILHESFPSSNALSLAVDSMLQKSIDALATIVESQASNATNVDPVDVVKFLTLSYAALSCGALLTDSSKESGNEKLKKLLSTIQIVLNAKFSMPSGVKVKREVVQACRSVFQYAKW